MRSHLLLVPVLAAGLCAQDPDGKLTNPAALKAGPPPTAAAPAANLNMTLVKAWDRASGIVYNDIWGWTSPTGREFVFVGETKGIWIVEATDPKNVKQILHLTAPSSTWRDFTNLGQYIYSVSEHHKGIRIIDMANPDKPKDLGYVHTTTITRTHNISADPASGHIYLSGTNQGLAIFDCKIRTAPKLVGTWKTSYTHDCCIRRGRAYLSNGRSYKCRIMNASNPAKLVEIGSAPTPGGYDHNVWVSDDDKVMCCTDELSRSGVTPHMTVWDISTPTKPVKKGDYDLGSGKIVHNVFLMGRTAYMSHYSDGVHMVDLADLTKPTRVGSYDTSSYTTGFRGCWGVYPFSDSGLVYGSDMQNGLYVWQIECGHLNRYGAATPGTGGRIPRMHLDGATPRVGASALRLECESMQPNANFVLAVSGLSGSSNLLGVKVHIGLTGYNLVFGKADANGKASIPAPVPDLAILGGLRLYSQIVSEDAGGPAGYAASRGMWVGICKK